MPLRYRTFHPSDKKPVSELIKKLYKEDFMEGAVMSDKKIQNTFDFLKKNPRQGAILVIESERQIIGYALLINFWSNEFGGNMLTIDELYIKKEFRNQGIGTNFIKHLRDQKFGNAVMLQIEVSPHNKKAKKFYETLGFEQNECATFRRKI